MHLGWDLHFLYGLIRLPQELLGLLELTLAQALHASFVKVHEFFEGVVAKGLLLKLSVVLLVELVFIELS